MAHVTGHRGKLLTRIRRIGGQVAALEKSLESDIDCAAVLHCPTPESARAAARQLHALAGNLTGAQVDGPHTYTLLHSLSVVG